MKQCQPGALPAVILILFAIILHGCGGGGGGAGSGSNSMGAGATNNSSAANTAGAGMATGTVTGFGSIVVDDQEYNETPATLYRTEAHGAPETLAADGVQLGQHVILSFDANGNITLVEVAPEVEGVVTSVTSSVTIGSGGSAATVPAMTVAGVLVVANSDISQGPVTNFGGGYTALSSVQVGDNVEVHGLLRSANGVDYVQATFVGKQPSFTGTRITGVVAGYDASNSTFTLGSAPNTITINAAGTALLPNGATLANGEVVSVWSNGTLTNHTLSANLINVRSQLGVAGMTLAVSGAISNYVSQANFVVNGVTVDASAITLPMDISVLSNGMVVAVSGTINNSGTLVAARLRVFGSRDEDNGMPQVTLQGDISDFVSASNFTVRGVLVDASQNPTFNAGFSAANLQNGAYVKISGTLSNNVVVATSIDFTSMQGTPVLDLRATVQSYDAGTGALSLSLQVPGSDQMQTVQVTLGNIVTFDNGNAAMLTAGQNIRIHAIYDAAANSFTITAITFLPQPPSDGTGDMRLLAGVITAVNSSGTGIASFVVHHLTINVGNANVTYAPGVSAPLAVGDLVVVYAQTTSTDDTLNASIILVAPPMAEPSD